MLNNKTQAVLVAGLLITCALGRILAGETGSRVGAQTTAGTMSKQSTADARSSSVEQTVEVRLTEFRIEMPLQLRAGQTVFKVTNAGKMFHSFEIEGKGIEDEVESGVDEGQTKTLKLDLKPGAYEVYCPVHGHKKAGMSVRVQVT
jgi:uncharacterized cupredoxin-like copper-binding protein